MLANPNIPPWMNEFPTPLTITAKRSKYQAVVLGKYSAIKGIAYEITRIAMYAEYILIDSDRVFHPFFAEQLVMYNRRKFVKNSGQLNTNPNTKLGSY